MSEYDQENIKGAIALGYRPDKDGAPKILAKGFGKTAEEIINTAEKNGIFVKEDKALFNSMKRLNVGDEIPPKLYYAAAEIIAYVYKINNKKLGI
jgi:flagellar biosynthesis protein